MSLGFFLYFFAFFNLDVGYSCWGIKSIIIPPHIHNLNLLVPFVEDRIELLIRHPLFRDRGEQVLSRGIPVHEGRELGLGLF